MSASNRGELLKFVRESPLFAQLSDESFEPIGRSIRFQDFDRGTVLFNQDEPANVFYIVVEGWIKVFRTTPAGTEAIIDVFTRGQSFAEIAALAKDNYPASSVAVSDVRLAAIAIRPIREAIAVDPQVALSMLASVSRHVRRLVDDIEQMKGLSGSQRVIEFIVKLSPSDAGSTQIQFPYEKTVIARKIGIKAESLSRVFKNLKKYGVKIENNMAIVDDVSVLRRQLESGLR